MRVRRWVAAFLGGIVLMLGRVSPMKKGRCGTMTHDYKRNGTTCLFAALNVLEGNVIGSCYPRHRNIEFRKFLRQIDRETSKGLAIHMIMDNYGTHNHPRVKAWLEKHPRLLQISFSRRIKTGLAGHLRLTQTALPAAVTKLSLRL